MAKITNDDILSNIKKIARAKKMTLNSLSESLGRHKNFVSTVINKKKSLVSLELLYNITEILECNIEDFLKENLDDNQDSKK
jgi:DNA-binding Xre family transcriptional regulator